MEKQNNKYDEKKPESKFLIIVHWFVRIVTILLLAYSIVGIVITTDDQQLSRHLFVTLNASILLISSFVPLFVEKKWQLHIPPMIELVYVLFCIAAMLIGEIGGLYAKAVGWDSIVHTLSGSLIAVVGFSLINLLNDNAKTVFHLSPFFVALFVFCFSLAVGVLWEVFEFMVDYLTGSNMQRYRDSISGIDFVGQAALLDTMKDLILDMIGAGVVTVIGYFDLKRSARYYERFAITKEDYPEHNPRIK